MKISDIFNAELGNKLLDKAVDYGTKKATSATSDWANDQINRALTKNRKGINKILDVMGLGNGGVSNLYAQAASMPDPLLDFEFTVYMPTISTAWAQADALKPMYIEDIDVPLESFEVDQIKVNGHPVNIIMFSSQPECTVNIYADYINVAQKYINAWYASIRSPNGRYNLPYAKNNAGYKKMIQVVIYKGAVPIAMIALSGSMPTNRGNYSLKSAGDGRQILAQTFAVDKVYWTFLDYQDPNKVQVASDGSILGNVASNALGALSTGLSHLIRGN